MISKWVGPLGLSGRARDRRPDRINRPGHKYRLTVEVETPEGIKSASGVMAVTPDRGYSRRGRIPHTSGDALFVDLGGGKNLVALLVHLDKTLDLDGINYVALRAYGAAAGQRVSFNEMSRMQGVGAGDGGVDPGARARSPIPRLPGRCIPCTQDDLGIQPSAAAFGFMAVSGGSGVERLLADRFRRRAR